MSVLIELWLLQAQLTEASRAVYMGWAYTFNAL